MNNGCRALKHPVARHVIPDLLAEVTRNRDLAEALSQTVRGLAGQSGTACRARDPAGELSADTNFGLCLDFLGGPLYWRLPVLHEPTDDAYLEQLADKIVAAMKVAPNSPAPLGSSTRST